MAQGTQIWPHVSQMLVPAARTMYGNMSPVAICSDVTEMNFRALQASIAARIHCNSMESALALANKRADEVVASVVSWERRHTELDKNVGSVFSEMECKDKENDVLKDQVTRSEMEVDMLEKQAKDLKKQIKTGSCELKKLQNLYDESVEELKDSEVYHIVKTTDKLMRKYQKGENLLWKPDEAVNHYLRCGGDLEDLETSESEDGYDDVSDTVGTGSPSKGNDVGKGVGGEGTSNASGKSGDGNNNDSREGDNV